MTNPYESIEVSKQLSTYISYIYVSLLEYNKTNYQIVCLSLIVQRKVSASHGDHAKLLPKLMKTWRD